MRQSLVWAALATATLACSRTQLGPFAPPAGVDAAKGEADPAPGSSSGAPSGGAGQAEGASGSPQWDASGGGAINVSSAEWRPVPTSSFWDNNGLATPIGDPATGYPRHNGYARLKLETSADADGWLGFEATPVSSAAGPSQDSESLSIRVDGVFNQTLPFDTSKSGVRQLRSTRVPAGAHTIEIEEGSREGFGGLFIESIQFRGSVDQPTHPKRRLVEDGDSIGEGALASPRSISWIMRERHEGRFDGVTVLGQSGQFAYNLTSDDLHRTQWAKKIASAADGTDENVIVIVLSTNDYIVGPWSAADYQLGMSAGVEAIHTLVPNAVINLVGMGALYNSGPNKAGSTQADYNNATAAVANARPIYCHYIDISKAYSVAQLVDGVIHPGNDGQTGIFNTVHPLL